MHTDVTKNIERFQTLPYGAPPFNSRAWGHSLHSLCSYQGKMKPSIAHWLVKLFVPEQGILLDPLGGVGTIPFEASSQGFKAVSNDKSIFASTIAKAKLSPPSLQLALSALESLAKPINDCKLSNIDIAASRFGLNSKVEDYFHQETLIEILKARKIFTSQTNWDPTYCFVWACLLHILHGNRPYALSRTSHPITPFAPKGPFEYKSLFEKLRGKIERTLKNPLPEQFSSGQGLYGDFREIHKKTDTDFNAIITSPPFMGMRFDRPNWLRLWFCGWQESDFHKTSLSFLERQQTKNLDCYKDFFTSCHKLLKAQGHLIIHIGSGKSTDLACGLKMLSHPLFKNIGETVEDVIDVERHGIADKGLTEKHHYIFLERK